MLPALLLAACAHAAPRSGLAEHAVYAELPLRNLSGDREAAEWLSARLREALQARGAAFVEAERVEALLVEHRIRYTDSLSADESRMIQAATGAQHVIAGLLFEFVRGKTPHIAMGLRVLDAGSGTREQSVVVSLRGEDSRGWLGLGAIEDAEELGHKVVERLLTAFGPQGAPLPKPGHAPSELRDIDDDRPVRAKRAQATPELGRLAVMPFVNRSTRPEAGVQFGEILANEWFHETGVEVVEASELRAAMVREKIRYMHDLDLRALAAIARAAGVRYFALGSVDQYGEEEQLVDGRFPVIEASIRLLDAQTGLVVASAAQRIRGDHHRQPLGFGLERDPVALAQQTARNLIRKLGE
jgi:TolB-like protein